jgi:hypothetical protein
MAANLDRAETSLTAVSDIAYIRGIDGSGNSVRISKADLASVLGALDIGIFFKKINFASVDSGLIHIIVAGYDLHKCHEIIVTGTNSAQSSTIIKVAIGLRANSGDWHKFNYISGTGKVYFKQSGNNCDYVILPDTSIDYSFGYACGNTKIVSAQIVNRNGYDLSDYTEMT